MAKEWMSLTLVDIYGRTTRMRREMQPHLLLAEYVAEIDIFVAALEAVTDLGVVRADFSQEGISTPSGAHAGSNVDVGATFSGWIVDGDGKKASTKLPGIKAAMVETDGSVDVLGAEIAAFLAMYADAGDFYISDGENVDLWIKGTLDR